MGGGGGRVGGSGWGGRGVQGGCEWRSEAFVKIHKKNYLFFLVGWGSGQGGSVRLGWCQGGWERRIEAFVKIFFFFFFFFFFWGGGGGRGVESGGQGGCEQRSKVFVKIKKKKIEGGGRGGSDQGLGWGRCGSKVWGRWVMWGMGDVNQE